MRFLVKSLVFQLTLRYIVCFSLERREIAKKGMSERLVVILLILTQVTWMLPAQEYGVDMRRGRQRLERYIDRAGREREGAGGRAKESDVGMELRWNER